MRLLILFATALGLSACQHAAAPRPVIQQVEVVVPKVPKRLRQCRDEPAPLPDDAVVGDIAPHHVDALAAGQDCRSKLRAVDTILTQAERRAQASAGGRP